MIFTNGSGGPQTQGQRRSFEELISAAVEQVFTEVFGETGRAFIFNSRRRKGLEKERIPEEIEKFSEEPVGMLGSGGLMLLNRILES